MTFSSYHSTLTGSGNGGTAVNAGNVNYGHSQTNFADASGHASLHGHGSYLTGETLVVSGGLTVR